MDEPTPDDPIQAQLIAARRNQIIGAAIKVFADKGFSRATIKDVAKEARIADGTIYNYFANKDALLLGILDRLNETAQRSEHFAQSMSMDLREWVNSYIKHRMETLQPEGIQVFQVLMSEVLVNDDLRDMYFKQIIEPTYTLIEPYYQQWIDQGKVTA